MRKFRLYFDKEKEEKWLNEMCRQGFAMKAFFAGMFTFEPCAPGEYIYRIDMPGEIGRMPVWEKNREYIALVEETGAEYVCKWGWWMIFRRRSAEGDFELYTDVESRIALYQRIRRMFVMIGLFELSIALQNTNTVRHFWSGRDVLNSFGGADVFYILSLIFMYFVAAVFFRMARRLRRKMKILEAS